MAGLLAVVSMGFGSSFPMVQITVQVAAGPERLGSATASVQFSRSLGAATGTALVGAVLFGALVAAGGEAASLFVALVNQGAGALAALPEAARAAFRAEMTGAFRAAFLSAAVMTGAGRLDGNAGAAAAAVMRGQAGGAAGCTRKRQLRPPAREGISRPA
jgi:hypothetical protein